MNKAIPVVLPLCVSYGMLWGDFSL